MISIGFDGDVMSDSEDSSNSSDFDAGSTSKPVRCSSNTVSRPSSPVIDGSNAVCKSNPAAPGYE